MSHPTRPHPQLEHHNSNISLQPAGDGVPLALWPHSSGGSDGRDCTRGLRHDGAGWLQRLLAECTPDGQTAHVYRVDDPTVADAAAQTTFAPTHGGELGLLVLRLERRDLDVATLTRLVTSAGSLLGYGGRLAVVTRAAAAGGRVLDPVSTAVQIAVAAGFGYLQHIVVADLVAIPDAPPDPANCGGKQPTRHPVRHLDISLFRLTSPLRDQVAQPVTAGR